MLARMPSRRALAAGAAAALTAGLVRERISPSACPYSQRWLLQVPRPWLSTGRLLEVLQPRPGERLLEVGPGTGIQTLPVARALEPGGTLDVFDVQQEMLDALMGRARDQGVSNLRPTQGDGRRLPYEDDAFDGAYLVTVLGEIPDQEAALAELRRVVKEGGRVVFGEIPLFDPHFVRFPVLVRRAEAAGFRLDGRRGPGLGFYARFR
jgi:SAM-dependent methyltransferase